MYIRLLLCYLFPIIFSNEKVYNKNIVEIRYSNNSFDKQSESNFSFSLKSDSTLTFIPTQKKGFNTLKIKLSYNDYNSIISSTHKLNIDSLAQLKKLQLDKKQFQLSILYTTEIVTLFFDETDTLLMLYVKNILKYQTRFNK